MSSSSPPSDVTQNPVSSGPSEPNASVSTNDPSPEHPPPFRPKGPAYKPVGEIKVTSETKVVKPDKAVKTKPVKTQ